MQKRLPVILGSQAYESEHRPAASERLVNMHAEIGTKSGKAPFTLHRNEGIEPYAVLGAGPVRGLACVGPVTYAVSGDQLYSVDPGGSATSYGLIPGEGPVQIVANTSQVGALNTDGDGFILADDGTLRQITDPDFPGAAWWQFFDDYFVFGFKDGTGWGLSDIGDGSSFDALDIASAESSPDDLIAGLRDGDSMLLFGTESIEDWADVGLPDFPFDRRGDGVYKVGCAAPRSLAVIDNATFFLAVEKGGRSIRRITGGLPIRVSTPAIDAWLDRQATVDDAYGLAFSVAGHSYYVLTLPTAGRTYAFDAANQRWTQRSSFGNDGLWRPSAIAALDGGGVLIGDSRSGRIGRISAAVHTEFGDAIPWETVSAPVQFERRMLSYDRIELEINAGQGLASGQGEDPQIWLAWSDDDGRTWSNQIARSTGRMGKYLTKVVWTNLGSATTRIFRFRGADPVLTGLITCWADVRVGI